MDVNAIGNNINPIKVYSTSNDILQNANADVNSNSEVLEPKQVEKNQENKNNAENKDGLDKQELDKAIKKLNKFLEDEKTHAEYAVHKDLGTMMVKIVDDDTKKIIVELPSQKILDMVASMCKQVGLLDQKA